MTAHRAVGFEVVALIDLPLTATPQDAEVALAASLTTLPETVALLEGVDTGIQGNQSLSDQVTAIANSSGRGLVTQDDGLNTVQKLADRARMARRSCWAAWLRIRSARFCSGGFRIGPPASLLRRSRRFCKTDWRSNNHQNGPHWRVQ